MSTAHPGPCKNCLPEPVARLGKAQVEALLAGYDAGPIEALTSALRLTLDAPMLEWAGLLELADLADERRKSLLRGDQGALDDLAAELNEVRDVAARTQRYHPEAADDYEPPTGTPHR